MATYIQGLWGKWSFCYVPPEEHCCSFVSWDPADLEEVKIQPARGRQRRRGRRRGIRQHLRQRGNRPPLPCACMILNNIRLLKNKIEELHVNSKVCWEYRESSYMGFTETCLHQDISDSLIKLEGFSLSRANRTALSGKSPGGWLCRFLNDSWCDYYTGTETVCTANMELLCPSLRPF